MNLERASVLCADYFWHFMATFLCFGIIILYVIHGDYEQARNMAIGLAVGGGLGYVMGRRRRRWF